MKKRRLLAWLMTLVMMVGLMPATALAAEEESNVIATKTVSGPNDDGEYTVTLTAKGGTTVSETENNLPADIVLVLDSSGSMDYCGGALSYDRTENYGLL
ncbi:MAG: hypothetical protein J6L66_08615, partial [Anaerotignum sp.]|nr:hypothetical protein [Anaerotignum sp.]